MYEALAALRQLILERYPEAIFEELYRDDPAGVRLRVIVDVDDSNAVLDVVIDKLYELQVERNVPIYVIPVQSPERTSEQIRLRPARTMSLPTRDRFFPRRNNLATPSAHTDYRLTPLRINSTSSSCRVVCLAKGSVSSEGRTPTQLGQPSWQGQSRTWSRAARSSRSWAS